MTQNSYEGMLESWKTGLMIRRARRMGFNDEALEDVLQDLALFVYEIKFDATKSQCMSEKSTLAVFIDNFLKNRLRSEKRRQARENKDADERGRDSTDFQFELNMQQDTEYEMVSDRLEPFPQAVFKFLREGKDTTFIARKLKVRWHTVKKAMEKIALELEARGIIPPDYLQST